MFVGTPDAAKPSSTPSLDTSSQSKWRVVVSRPLLVNSEADERKGTVICELMKGARVTVLDQFVESRPDDSVRALVVDPVWLGWLTLTTRTGANNLERLTTNHVEKPPGAAASAAHDDHGGTMLV